MTGSIVRSVVVSGEVQGVFFRDCMRREARSSGVRGWVRNRPDGRVEAHLEGTPDAVAALVLWCRSGPPRASVEELVVSEVAPEGLEDFAIR